MIRLLVSTLALMLCALPAQAEKRPVSVGPYAGVAIGGRTLIGKNRKHAAIGPTFGLRVGTDLFRWLSVGARLDISNHEATVPAPPEGEYLQLYGAAAEARLSLSLWKLAFYTEGSLGYGAISTNILEKVDLTDPGERFSPVFGAGGGVEYQLQNRHYAMGVGGDWTMYGAFRQLQAVSVQAHLRYTY